MTVRTPAGEPAATTAAPPARRTVTLTRWRLAAALAATAVLAAGTAAAAVRAAGRDVHDAEDPAAATERTDIAVPPGSRRIGTFEVVTGTRYFRCAGGAYGPPEPVATLRGDLGEIRLSGGPTWRYLTDGSAVEATAVAAAPRPGAVPELLLDVTGHRGTGLLDRADHIQRVATSGGLTPSDTCTDGAVAAVPYGATYVFWDAP